MTNEERSQAIADMRRMKAEYMNGREMDKITERKCKSFDIATKALEQQPCERFEWGIDGNVYKITKAKDGKEICQQICNDAISREAVFHILDEMVEDLDDKREAVVYADSIADEIAQLPSVQPSRKGHWIPVSERLPNDGDYVLVCYENGHIRTAYYYIDTNIYPSEFEDCCETGWYNYNEDFMYEQDVIAWMPFVHQHNGCLF